MSVEQLVADLEIRPFGGPGVKSTQDVSKAKGLFQRKQCLKENGSSMENRKELPPPPGLFPKKIPISSTVSNPSGTSVKSSLLSLSKSIMHFPDAANLRRDKMGPRRTA